MSHPQFFCGLQSRPSPREKGEMTEFASRKAVCKLSHFSLEFWRRYAPANRIRQQSLKKGGGAAIFVKNPITKKAKDLRVKIIQMYNL